MTEILEKYIPQASVSSVFDLVKLNDIHLKIVNERVTRHGDYRKLPDGQHQITVNANLNPYRFLNTGDVSLPNMDFRIGTIVV